MMKGAQGLVQPQTITPSVVCRRRGVSRPWEAVVPSTGVVPSKEGRAETGEQLAGACWPLLGMGSKEGGQGWAGLAKRMVWSV